MLVSKLLLASKDLIEQLNRLRLIPKLSDGLFYCRRDLMISAIARKMPGRFLIRTTMTINTNIKKGCGCIPFFLS